MSFGSCRNLYSRLSTSGFSMFVTAIFGAQTAAALLRLIGLFLSFVVIERLSRLRRCMLWLGLAQLAIFVFLSDR